MTAVFFLTGSTGLLGLGPAECIGGTLSAGKPALSSTSSLDMVLGLQLKYCDSGTTGTLQRTAVVVLSRKVSATF